MPGKLGSDTSGNTIQGFAPTRIQTVTTSEWTPGANDSAFCVAADCTYQINAAGGAGSLRAGDIRVIVQNQTYKFSVGQNLEVM